MAPRFDPVLLFRVLLYRFRIRSLPFILGSPTSRSDSILSFYFGFSGILPGFDLFVLFRVLRHRARIRFLRFVSGSPASGLDSIP